MYLCRTACVASLFASGLAVAPTFAEEAKAARVSVAAPDPVVIFDTAAFLHTAVGDLMPNDLLQLDTRELVLKVRRHDQGGTLYYFEDPGNAHKNASLFLRDGRLTGSIWGNDARLFSLTPLGDGASSVRSAHANDLPRCGCGSEHAPEMPASASRRSGASNAGDGGVAGNCDDGTRLDIVFWVSGQAQFSSGFDQQQIVDMIAQAVADMNLSFANSGIPMQANVVGIEFSNLALPGACIQDQFGWVAQGSAPQIQALRLATKADLVSVVSIQDPGCPFAGLAFLLPSNSETERDNGLNILDLNALSSRLLAHEVGHNFGACHTVETGCNAFAYGIFPYSKAHSFPSAAGSTVHTVVSQGFPNLPLYSTPNVLVDGVPAGIADDRDNARTLNETRLAVTNFLCDESGNCGTGGNCYIPSDGLDGLFEPGCANASCCEAVCAKDPTCCTEQWDAQCALFAFLTCSDCGDPNAGSCEEPHATPSCADESCCKAVCVTDAYCCDVAWDATCVQVAGAQCAPQCGEPGTESCFVAHAGHSCRNATCCENVCVIDPTCCTQSWDESCVKFALSYPPCIGVCGAPGTGSCTEVRETPSCSDAECCERVCAIDPSCCFESWDASCVVAVTFGGACEDPYCGAPFLLPCEFINDRPFCSDASCCETVCAAQPTCCQIAWDANCAQAANILCAKLECGSPAAGSCVTAHADPFCSDTLCCAQTCAVDPTCCSESWDQSCADIALQMQCGDEFCRAVTCYFQPSCCEAMWDASCSETANDFCPGPCRADLNRNGTVGAEDLATLLNQWGLDEFYIADQDYDGIVDGTDLALLLGAWGSNCN